VYNLKECPSRDDSMVGHPVVIRAKTDDVSWYILTSLHSRLDAVLRDVELEVAVRDLAVVGY
jgi:hypothetical protein